MKEPSTIELEAQRIVEKYNTTNNLKEFLWDFSNNCSHFGWMCRAHREKFTKDVINLMTKEKDIFGSIT